MKTSALKKPETAFSFELSRAAPVETVVALYKAGGWWVESPAARASIPRMIENSFAFAVAKDAAGEIVGMGRVISDGCSDAYIQDVVVLPEFRGQGIGGGLVSFLAAYCRSKEIPWIGLVAEPGTGGFYRKLGFQDKKGYQLMLFAPEGAA